MTGRQTNRSLPGVGTSFKSQHASDIAKGAGPVGWFEVHPENYMVAGGPRLRQLEELRSHFPLSLHGVGLSLGGHDRPSADHLAKLKDLVDRFEPALVSEHIAWSVEGGLYLADLLPAPLTEEALAALVRAIDDVQETLGRTISVENPARYLALPDDRMPETEFLAAVAKQSGCGLLIDVNNIFVSAHNLGFDAAAYVDALPVDAIGEIHLAGHAPDEQAPDEHTPDEREGERLLIDTHGAPVSDPVWSLYERLLTRAGPRPTLVEWDTDVPAWSVLRAEAEKAKRRLDSAPSAKVAASATHKRVRA